MNYFQGFTLVSDIKVEYRNLAFKHHPDLGGDTETMKVINRQYEDALKHCSGQTTKGSDGKDHSYKWDEETERKLIEIIDKLLALRMESVDISIIGLWIWITGETKPHRAALGKDGLGCTWHATRGCWYYKPYESKSYRSTASLEDLAGVYGKADVSDLKKKPRSPGKKIKSA